MTVQRQQTDIFVDGLQEDKLKLNFLRANTQMLDAVITTAINEQNLCEKFVYSVLVLLGINIFS